VEPAGRFALGRLHLGVLQPDPQLATPGPVRVLFHGEIDNPAELHRRLVERGVRPPPLGGTASLVAALYEAEGEAFAAGMKGSFCAAVLDEGAGRLVLASDLTGSYPLYWSEGPDRVAFAGELKALMGDPGARLGLDPQAIGDYLSCGFVLGDKTLASGVRLLPPASTLTYAFGDGGRVAISRYRDLRSLFETSRLPWEELAARVRDAFGRAVERALAGDHRLAIALSGGLDTRAILSAAPREARLFSYTLGVRGCADHVIGEELARLAGLKHRFIELDGDYLGDYIPNLRNLVSLTDGLYLSHGFTEMLALRFLEEVDSSVLVRGHGGELAKADLAWPFHTDAAVRSVRSREDLISLLLRRFDFMPAGVSLRVLLTDAWFDRVEGAARRSLAESLDRAPESPGDACAYLYLVEHHRRSTVASLELFRNCVEIRMPFLDHDFLAEVFRLPVAFREGCRIHRAIIEARHPALGRVRNSNTGAAATAAPWVEAVLSRVNEALKRLNVYGYRHYHSFKRWMRGALLEVTTEALLSPEALSRGVFRPETVRRLAAEARRDRADHGHLFQILLILELWQRENL